MEYGDSLDSHFISIALRAHEPSLALFALDAVARLSGRQLLAVAAGTVAIAANAVVTEWFSQWRQAIAWAPALGRTSS